MTLKIKKNVDLDIVTSHEYNYRLDNNFEISNFSNEVIKKLINEQSIPENIALYLLNVELLGSIINYRYQILLNEKYPCELDKTIFNDKFTEFELECEDTIQIPELRKYLKTLNIDINNISTSKYARFIDYLSLEKKI